MEKQYLVRKPTDLEKEKYLYTVRDEKDIPLGTLEPFEMLQYRGYVVPIYCDDYDQQYFVRFDDEEWGNPLGDYDDFMDFIDKKLDYLVPTESPTKIFSELLDLSASLSKLTNTAENKKICIKASKTFNEVNKYLQLFRALANLIKIEDNSEYTSGDKYRVKVVEGVILDDMLLDQLKRALTNTYINTVFGKEPEL